MWVCQKSNSSAAHSSVFTGKMVHQLMAVSKLLAWVSSTVNLGPAHQPIISCTLPIGSWLSVKPTHSDNAADA